MGYTHYYRQQRDYTEQEWDRLIEATKKIFAYCEQNGIILENDSPLSERGIAPIADENMIWFNGQESSGLSHESFVLSQTKGDDFSFCKTAQKPYDNAVCMVLLSSHSIAPEVLEISSDGEFEEWKPIIDDWENLFNDSINGKILLK